MINRLKLAIVDENYDELEVLADELENAINNGWLESLSDDELVELKALYTQVNTTLLRLKQKDLEKVKKLKQSLKYIKD